MTVREIVIDWEWGAQGIWSVPTVEEQAARSAQIRAAIDAGARLEMRGWQPPADHDRHRAWRGLLTDDLIDALQEWNDRGGEIVGRGIGTRREREEFWADGQALAVRVQEQLGAGYAVRCGSGGKVS